MYLVKGTEVHSLLFGANLSLSQYSISLDNVK